MTNRGNGFRMFLLMKQISFRLKPGQLLKETIENLAREKQIGAGVLLSVVGGLGKTVLRMVGSDSNNQTVKTWDGPFEIVAGTGTICIDGCHIHISVSDKDGNVIGGHLKDGCVVKYTAEVIIGIFDEVTFARKPDSETGFDELIVSENAAN